MHRRRVRALGLALLPLVSASSCAGDDNHIVTIFGPEVGNERESLVETLEVFTERTGIRVQVEGTRDFEALIEGRIAAGDPPDIAMFPQPARLRELNQDIRPLSADVTALVSRNFDDALTESVTFGGGLKAIPVKSDLKSLVWYSPAAFDEEGYEIPETFEDFLALAEQMRIDENPPFCVGMESGEASGWPMTDWIEDWMLRLKGPDLYDRWVNHDIPFDHPEVVEVGQAVSDLWSTEGAIYGGTDAATVTFFEDAALPVLEGECMMHRQASFAGSYWPEGTILRQCRDGGAILEECTTNSQIVDAFFLPGSQAHPDVALSGGLYAATLSDNEDAMRVMGFIASADFANTRAANDIGGFLSPNGNVDADLYPDDLTRSFAEILGDDGLRVRYDASDLMPPAVSSAFWAASVDMTVGTKTVDEAFADVETIWAALEASG